MKISFFDDEPEIFPLQYGGKARTITNLAKEFIKLPDVDEVTILSKSIYYDKEEFIKDNIRYVVLNDENIIEKIVEEMNRVDIINIHCCSFTFPNIKGKAKKIYFLHDILIATAEKGSHLDKSLGGDFDVVVAPSEFAKSIEKNLPENFIDTGWIESKDLKYYYSISDVTLNLSELPESFSQVCIESTYCGTPVVAFESGNIPYLSNEIGNIFIVNKNVEDIKQGIDKAIELKDNQEIKNKVKYEIEKKYSVDKVVNNYMQLYKKYMEE